ncbi:hypothetical protein [Streptomyces canus]|uniref:hypothetical protein n=1 Tax=Streptomyces canus TaxID=58343 RepID=UPI002781C0A1|nr:hypothetical protein [Streptomyces canus]MDQ0758733.1 hypothetical protein [Streptomyces canus]
MATAITQLPTPTTTAPLSPAASAATEPLSDFAAKLVDRLDLRLNAPEVLPAVARYEVGAFRTAHLSARLFRYGLSDADFGSLEFWQDVMREARATLADAGRLDLIGGGV